MRGGWRPVVRLTAAALLIGCGGGVRPLVAGTDVCEYCRMTVSDVRFGAEAISRTGRVYTFDSIECAASWLASAPQGGDPRGVWVADYASGTLISADSALFVKGGSVRSPMGRALAAFDMAVGRPALVERYGGEVLSWADVVTYMRAQGLPGVSGPPPAATRPGTH